MSKITYQQVKEVVESNGWQLLSTTYKNLNEPLTVKCENGHLLNQSFKQLRKKCLCNECLKDSKFIISNSLKRENDKFRILAIDQATVLTGWSLWEDGKLIGYGVFQADESLNTMNRIIQVRQWLIKIVEISEPNLIGLEDIQLQEYSEYSKKHYKKETPGLLTYKTLSKLQGVLESAIIELNKDYEITLSSTWRADLNIYGRNRKEKKLSTQNLIKDSYGIVATEDEADAIGQGLYLTRKHCIKNIKMHYWK